MDQIGVGSLRSVLKLVKGSLKSTLIQTFPNIPENVLDLQVNSVHNQLEYEYQSPAILKLFNQLKKQNIFGDFKTAKEVADKVAASHNVNDNVIKRIESVDQGFLNISLNDNLIEQEINSMLKYGLNYPAEDKIKIVVDFSSPNIAKEMHVGHLRSTIIGESICRILEYQQHTVKRVNHLGDWGTQFGMLVNYLFLKYPDYKENKPVLKELEQFYREAKLLFDSDEQFKKNSQLMVVKLQAYDQACIDAWKMICELSRQEFTKIYKRLDINVEDYGESFYNKMIPNVVKECEDKGIVELDKGAKIIRIKGHQIPLMIIKSDGGYNYDTTDMAAVRYRLFEEKATRVIYITDVGQLPHFKLIWDAAKMMGWHQPPNTVLEHMGFGLVRGADGKKIKTRSGDSVKLLELLDEARDRALEQIKQRSKDQAEGKEFSTGTSLKEEEYNVAAERIGIAAVKYFDLKQNRISDYNFDYDRMLDPKGNTAVYLMYSYVRICSILRKSNIEDLNGVQDKNPFKVTHPYERYLAASLIKFIDVVQSVTEQLAINWLCDFIYDICTKISESYSKYRILDDENTQTRILLCEAVRKVLKQAFFLVGIEPVEKI